MKALKTLIPAAVLAAALAGSASSQAATVISIGASVNGGAIGLVSSGATNTGVIGLALGPFDVNNLSAHTGPGSDLLDSNAFDVANDPALGPAFAGGTLDIYVTLQGLMSPVGSPGFLSALTSNALSGGWTVTESTFLNQNNALWGVGGTLMDTHTFSTIGSQSSSSGTATGAGPYSLTEIYHVVAPGSGNANSTMDIFAVPEPSTWALMIMGFGGVGALVRNRRRQAAFA